MALLLPRLVLASTLVLALFAPAVPGFAQDAPPPTVSDGAKSTAPSRPPADAEFNARVYPLTVWGPQVGFGFGAGLVVHDAVRHGSQVLVTAAPSQHQQVGTLSIASMNPTKAQTFVLFDARARRTNRQWVYGLGPASSNDARTRVGLTTGFVRLRIGHREFDRRLLIQPFIQGDLNNAWDVADNTPANLGQSDDLGTQLGARYGFDMAFDRRDREYGTTRGILVQATLFRYAELSNALIAYDRLLTGIYGYVPLGGRHRLAVRAHLTLTNDRSDVPLPFYQQVRLDGRIVPGFARDRFFGNDRIVTSLLYRFPIYTVADLITVEGHVGVHAASVYDDLGTQFALDATTDASVVADPTVPLRTAVSTGLRLGPIFRDETYLDLAVGAGPDGVTGVRMTFRRPLTQIRPPHHHGWID